MYVLRLGGKGRRELLDTLCNNIDGPPPYSTDRVDLIYYNQNQ